MTAPAPLVWTDALLLGYSAMDRMHEDFVQTVQALREAPDDQLVQALALAKARAVMAELRAPSPGELPITTVLGCDSVLAWQGEVFGKPVDAQEAISRWRRMAGGWGELHTGHCLLGAESADGGQPSPLRLTTITDRKSTRLNSSHT